MHPLTEEIKHQIPLHNHLVHIPKHNKRRRDLAQAKRLGRVGKAILWVVRARLDLAVELRVGQHGRGERLRGPVLGRGGEDSGVEDVVVAEEGVCAGEGGVVFEDVVAV